MYVLFDRSRIMTPGIGEGVMYRIGYFLSDDPSIGRSIGTCVRASPGWMIRWFESVSSAETAGLARTTKRGPTDGDEEGRSGGCVVGG